MKVQCEACYTISNKEDWKPAAVVNEKFVGGCPVCKGEFYKEVKEK